MTPEELQYDFTPQFDSPANTHHIQMRMVDQGSYVLDVGCHTGIIGEELQKRRQAKVVGIDTDHAALEIAKQRLSSALYIDIEHSDWATKLIQDGYHNFDTIIFGDVLEHTRYPERILNEVKELLKPNGSIIVSLPNIAYWRVRLGLLLGRFDYTDTGILDRTHLRFFTRRSAGKLLEDAGYQITESDTSGFTLPHWLLRSLPGLLGFQRVMKATLI
jgi:methionine biosynthesis protein MetW